MILCPLLPKAYVEEAKKALKTNDEDVVNAAFIQWYQLHPDLTEYPSMEELSKYNTRVTNVKRNREYKQLAYRNSVKQKTQYIHSYYKNKLKQSIKSLSDIKNQQQDIKSKHEKLLGLTKNPPRFSISYYNSYQSALEHANETAERMRINYNGLYHSIYVKEKSGSIFVFVKPKTEQDIIDEHIDLQINNYLHSSNIEEIYNSLQNQELADEMLYHIKKNEVEKIKEAVRKKNTTITEKDLQETFQFLIDLPNEKELNLYVNTCIRWLKNDEIRLPRDDQKLRYWFETARKNNIDISGTNSPFDLIKKTLEYAEQNKKLTAAIPFDARDYKHIKASEVLNVNGERVVIYDVEENPEGQKDVCKILYNTSDKINGESVLGSPWCLSTFTNNGEPTQSAKNFWDRYPGKRQIAIWNNKPIAFRSTDTNNKNIWWSFRDNLGTIEDALEIYKNQKFLNLNLRLNNRNPFNTQYIKLQHYEIEVSNTDNKIVRLFDDENNIKFTSATEEDGSFRVFSTGGLQVRFLPETKTNYTYNELEFYYKNRNKIIEELRTSAYKELINYISRKIDDLKNSIDHFEKYGKLYLVLKILDWEIEDVLSFIKPGDHSIFLLREEAIKKLLNEYEVLYNQAKKIKDEQIEKEKEKTEKRIKQSNKAIEEITSVANEQNNNIIEQQVNTQVNTTTQPSRIIQNQTYISEYVEDYPTQTSEYSSEYDENEEEEIEDLTDEINEKYATNFTKEFITKILNLCKIKSLKEKYNEGVLQKENVELQKELQSILKDYGVEYVFTDLQKTLGTDALGALDFINKIIYLHENYNERNALTGTEEFAHQFIKFMGTKYLSKKQRENPKNKELLKTNEEYNKLIDLLKRTTIYQQTIDEYKDNEEYKFKNGSINYRKIQEEALGKALAAVINEKYDEQSHDYTFLQKLEKWFKNLVKTIASLFADKNTRNEIKLQKRLDKIAESIFNGTYKEKYLNKVNNDNLVLLDYETTLRVQTEQDGGKALNILQTASSEGGIITGSISYRGQGTMYRKSQDTLHDIDIIVPNGVSKFYYNQEVNTYHKTMRENYGKNIDERKPLPTQERLVDIVEHNTYFLKLKAKFPSLQALYCFNTNPNCFVANCIICDNQELVNRFKSLSGNFNERLNHFTEEERNQIYLLDLFYNRDENFEDTVLDEKNKILLAHYSESFSKKLQFSRAKDLNDYQKFIPLPEYRKQLKQDLMLQTRQLNLFDESQQQQQQESEQTEQTEQNTSKEKTYADKIIKSNLKDEKRKAMRDDLSSEEISEFSKIMSKLFMTFLNQKIENLYNNQKTNTLLTGNVWEDKATIVKLFYNELLDQVKKELELTRDESDADMADFINRSLKHFETMIPYVDSLLQYNLPVSLEALIEKEQKQGNEEDNDISNDNIEKNTDITDDDVDEETLLEHWQVEHQSTSITTTMSPITKDILNSIVDEDEEKSDCLGYPENKNFVDVVTRLNKIIGECNEPKEMIPALQEATKENPWIQQILDILTGKNIERYTLYKNNLSQKEKITICQNLQAKFWKDLHKPFIQLGEIVINENKQAKTKDIKLNILNEEEVDDTSLSLTQGIILSGKEDDTHIFKEDGKLNEKIYNETYEKVHDKIKNLFSVLNNKDEIKNNSDAQEQLYDIITSLGLNISYEEYLNTLKLLTNEQIGQIKNALFNGIFNSNKNNNEALQGLIKNPEDTDVFSSFFRSYKTLINVLFANTTEKREKRITTIVDGKVKTLYSNVLPNKIVSFFQKMKDIKSCKQYIEENFMTDFHFRDNNNRIQNVWLRELYDAKISHNSKVQPLNLVASNGVSYLKENAEQSKRTRISMFFKGKDGFYTYYSFPTFADGKASYYIKNKIRTEEECIDGLADLFWTELDRITYIQAKKKAIEAGRAEKIEFFDSKDMFIMFPEFNSRKEEIIKELNSRSDIEKQQYIRDLIREQINKNFEQAYNEDRHIYNDLNISKEEAKEYYVNQYLANACIDNIFHVDNAFFKNEIDKQKRAKKDYTPYQTAYTTVYLQDKNGNISEQQLDIRKDNKGRPIEFFILLKDEEMSSTTMNHMISSLYQKYKNGDITKEFFENIINNLKKAKLTDGQAYRNLESYKNFLNAVGQLLNKQTRDAIDRLLNGTWSENDYKQVYNVLKPFVSSYMDVNTHLTKEDFGGNITDEQLERFKTIKVPTMHKDSEFLLLASYSFLQGEIKKSAKLKALNEFMDEYGIDKALFESSNKTGNHGAIDFNIEIQGVYDNGKFLDENGNEVELTSGAIYSDIANDKYYVVKDGELKEKSFDDVVYSMKEYLRMVSGIEKQGERVQYNKGYNDNIIHTIPMQDWGIVTNLPEHLLKHNEGGLSTQLIKIIEEDLDNKQNIDIVIDNKKYTLTGQQVKNIFQKLLSIYVEKEASKAKDKFNIPINFKEFVEKGIESDNESSTITESLQIDPMTGDFVLSPLNPIRNNKFVSMCTSYLRKKVIRRNIKQGLLPQVSNFGLENQLALRYQDKNGNMIFNIQEFYNPKKLVDKTYAKRLEEMRTKYDGDYKKYLNSEDGKGTRILYLETATPIQDKSFSNLFGEKGKMSNSTFNQNVKPALRKGIGSRTPCEGKHSIVPTFQKFLLPFQNASCIMTALEWMVISGSDFDSDKLFQLIKEVFTDQNGIFHTVKFDIKEETDDDYQNIMKSIDSNSTKACNNLLIDIMTSILQSEENTKHILTPNGFETIRKSVRVIDIIKNPKNKHSISELLRASNDEIEKIYNDLESKKDQLSVINPNRRTTEHIANMAGLNMVAIFAVFRVFTSLVQKVNAQYDGSFELNNNISISDKNLTHKQNRLKQFITGIVTELIGTSVDNAKDPLIDKFGITEELVPYVIFMIYRGYTTDEIALLLNQPIIKDVINELKTNPDLSLYTILSRIIGDKQMQNMMLSRNPTVKKLYAEDLAYCLQHENDEGKTERYDITQYAVAYNFAKLIKPVNMLNDVAKLCRNSTYSGATGSFDSDIISKLHSLYKTKAKYASKPPIQGLMNLIETKVDEFEHTLQTEILEGAKDLLKSTSFALTDSFVNLITYMSNVYGINVSADEVSRFKNHVLGYKYAEKILNVNNEQSNKMFDTYSKVVGFLPQIFFVKNKGRMNNEEFINTYGINSTTVSYILTIGVPELIRKIRNKYDIELFNDHFIPKRNRFSKQIELKPTKDNLDGKDLEVVRNAWLDMLNNEDFEIKDNNGNIVTISPEEMASLIYAYTLQTTGTTPRGENILNGIYPGEEVNITYYKDVTNSLQNTFIDNEEVLKSYILNNWKTSKMVSKFTLDEFKGFLGTENNQVKIIPSVITVPYTAKYKGSFMRDGKPIYGINVNNEILYICTKIGAREFEYTRMNPMGGQFLVEYFTDVESINSDNNMESSQNSDLIIMNENEIFAEEEDIENVNFEAINSAAQMFGIKVDEIYIETDELTNNGLDDTQTPICRLKIKIK